jgi:hypothetical protein
MLWDLYNHREPLNSKFYLIKHVIDHKGYSNALLRNIYQPCYTESLGPFVVPGFCLPAPFFYGA